MSSSAVAQPVQQTYDPAFFDELFAVEDQHFWFRSRNQAIAALVKQLVAGLAPGYRVLEPGCGTGNVLRALADTCTHGTVIGMDLFVEGLRHARQRVRCPLIQADIRNACFTEAFQVIGLFDVLEHLPDDREALANLYGMLSPGGAIVITVPAHQALWSYFDEAGCHFRRYHPDDLVQKLQEAGYQVEFVTQYMAALLPLVWLSRRVAELRRKRGGSTQDAHAMSQRELRIIPGFNTVLNTLLAWEAGWLSRRRTLPFGTSLVAIGRKR